MTALRAIVGPIRLHLNPTLLSMNSRHAFMHNGVFVHPPGAFNPIASVSMYSIHDMDSCDFASCMPDSAFSVVWLGEASSGVAWVQLPPPPPSTDGPHILSHRTPWSMRREACPRFSGSVGYASRRLDGLQHCTGPFQSATNSDASPCIKHDLADCINQTHCQVLQCVPRTACK
ncbi:hypothetical protein VFPPC_15162 [Pochonia chlamydosporia 170]|uniref:Uncharacterized protein n=1 Tax=Pochonia chlamydosporia 170 TaxID=1380566 RepID=A0A179G5E7_METCM|nr:hypothetical protein VFPPC_15162 [Pochonia chlamydosporia 170]OAQ72583.1 hypothetical protein VFPPC_15162 [Pochonia chlamydosporia 170]